MQARLHFVYNTDGTPTALLTDFLHRIRSPETYPCRLCDLTYGRFMKRAEWSDFIAGLGIPASFHLRNSFLRTYPELARTGFPALYAEDGGRLRLLISPGEFDEIPDLEALKELVAKKVSPLR